MKMENVVHFNSKVDLQLCYISRQIYKKTSYMF